MPAENLYRALQSFSEAPADFGAQNQGGRLELNRIRKEVTGLNPLLVDTALSVGQATYLFKASFVPVQRGRYTNPLDPKELVSHLGEDYSSEEHKRGFFINTKMGVRLTLERTRNPKDGAEYSLYAAGGIHDTELEFSTRALEFDHVAQSIADILASSLRLTLV